MRSVLGEPKLGSSVVSGFDDVLAGILVERFVGVELEAEVGGVD